MADFFMALMVRPPEQLAEERFRLIRAGLSYLDWRAMTRWQTTDFLRRHLREAQADAEEAKTGLTGVVKVVLKRILGA